MKGAVTILAGLAALALPRLGLAYCPCYTASSPNNSHDCGIEAADGTNPDTATWNTIFDLVSQGPAVWGNAGPSCPDIGQGCGKPEAAHDVTAHFPCELLKGITKQESGWKQFCVPSEPGDQVGGPSRTIIAFDCGYGVGQVTSGMHKGENPAFDRNKVASDPTYNLATGTQIIAQKWNATKCVGDNQPDIIEDWYTATWAYNGLSYSNNPTNPNYDSNRGVWDPQMGGGAPYQEKVFGWIEHTGGAWPATDLAYPKLGDIGGSGSPPDLPDPSCASPTNCNQTRAVHMSACNGQGSSTSSGATTGSSDTSAATTGAGAASSTSETVASVGTGAGGAKSGAVGVGGSSASGGELVNGGDPSADSGCSCRIGEGDAPRYEWLSGLALAFCAIAGRRRARRAS